MVKKAPFETIDQINERTKKVLGEGFGITGSRLPANNFGILEVSPREMIRKMPPRASSNEHVGPTPIPKRTHDLLRQKENPENRTVPNPADRINPVFNKVINVIKRGRKSRPKLAKDPDWVQMNKDLVRMKYLENGMQYFADNVGSAMQTATRESIKLVERGLIQRYPNMHDAFEFSMTGTSRESTGTLVLKARRSFTEEDKDDDKTKGLGFDYEWFRDTTRKDGTPIRIYYLNDEQKIAALANSALKLSKGAKDKLDREGKIIRKQISGEIDNEPDGNDKIDFVLKPADSTRIVFDANRHTIDKLFKKALIQVFFNKSMKQAIRGVKK